MRHKFFLAMISFGALALIENGAFAQAFSITARGSAEFYSSASCQTTPSVTWEELTELAIENGEHEAHISCNGTHKWLETHWTTNEHCGSVYSGPADPVFKYTVRVVRRAMCIPF